MGKVCSFCGSDKSIHLSGLYGDFLCSRHYDQFRLHGKFLSKEPLKRSVSNKLCIICNSDNHIRFNNQYGGFLCSRHYDQFRLHGKFFKRTIYDPNEIIICQDHAEIVMYDKRGRESAKAKISLGDVSEVKKYKWTYVKKSYVHTNKNGRILRLHRFLMNLTDGRLMIDHINRDILDNRRQNLRIVTPQENLFNKSIQTNNSSGYVGVFWHAVTNKWCSQIKVNRKMIYLGLFNDKEDAADAYKKAKEKYHKIGGK